jgi:hypothetical protein
MSGEAMTDASGSAVDALPHDRPREFLEIYNRLAEVK